MLISGELLQKNCHWNIDDRYPIRWDFENIIEGDYVFMKNCDIQFFLNKTPKNKVNIVVHNSDETFTDDQYNLLVPFALNIYAVNSSCSSAIPLPLGFRDNAYTDHQTIIEELLQPEVSRDIICLVNFLIHTNIQERTSAFNYFKDKDFATVQDYYNYNFHKSLSFKDPETIQKRRNFYKTLKRTKFAICPFGTGKDTHRVYECLLFDVVPIVKTSFLDKLYSKYNIWIVKDWSEVTLESMNSYVHKNNTNQFENIISRIHFISYGDDNFAISRERIKNHAIVSCLFKTINIYSPDFLDEPFKNDFKYLLSQKKGAGYWCWKYFILLETMKAVKENDWILYADAGCTLVQPRNEKLLDMIREMEKNNKFVSAYKLSDCTSEEAWTKNDLFIKLGIDEESDLRKSYQYVGGVFLIKNNKIMRDLISNVKEFIKNNQTLVDDTPSTTKNADTFKEHRHDQSVFSLFRKLNNEYVYMIERDETWLGNDFVQATRLRK